MIVSDRHQFGDNCRRVAEVLQRVSDKWSILLVVLLEHGPRRFNDLKRSVPGISQRMLTLTLRGLERDGLVGRAVVASVPPRVEYVLTDLGRSFAAPARALHGWVEGNIPAIDAARARHDAAQAEKAAP